MIGVGIDVGKFALDLARHDQSAVYRFDNTASGIAGILEHLAGWGETQVVLEATGGLEKPVLEALIAAGHAVSRVNPRKARNFARASGELAKTDALAKYVAASRKKIALLLDLRQLALQTGQLLITRRAAALEYGLR